jgi:hypothetical protein
LASIIKAFGINPVDTKCTLCYTDFVVAIVHSELDTVMNVFEHLVLSRVAECLGVNINDRYMSFYEGTLFVKDLSTEEIDRIYNDLVYSNRFGKIIMSNIGNNVAFDFV